MFELEFFKRVVLSNQVQSKQLYKIFLNLLLLKNETFSQMFLQGTKESLSSYYLSLQKDYLTFLSQYFIKKGNKNKVENLFRKFFLKLKKRKNPSRRWAKKTWRSFLKCKYNAMYYIRLKIRKRRRRVKYRVTYLESYRWLKKSVLPLAKTVKESKLRTFSDAFYKEFLLLRSGKSGITVKRNEYHKLAYMRAPYSWKRQRKFKQKRQKNLTWRFFKVWNRKIRKRKWSVWLKKASGYSYANRVKKSILKKRFNQWVSQYLVNQETFDQSVEKTKKDTFSVNSGKKVLKSNLGITGSKNSPFLYKNGYFFSKLRVVLYSEINQNNKTALIKIKHPTNFFLRNNTFSKKKLLLETFNKTKLNLNLIFNSTLNSRENFVKNYLLPKKFSSKIDLTKAFPLINNRFLFNFGRQTRINLSKNVSIKNKDAAVLKKNIYIKKLKRLNSINFFKFKNSKYLFTSSFLTKNFKEQGLEFKFLNDFFKGKNSLKVISALNGGKILKLKSTYDHSFKTLNFFSVALVWQFLESRLLKNLTANEHKKIEKDAWRKKKYQFIKKMFYYIRILYRDLYQI